MPPAAAAVSQHRSGTVAPAGAHVVQSYQSSANPFQSPVPAAPAVPPVPAAPSGSVKTATTSKAAPATTTTPAVLDQTRAAQPPSNHTSRSVKPATPTAAQAAPAVESSTRPAMVAHPPMVARPAIATDIEQQHAPAGSGVPATTRAASAAVARSLRPAIVAPVVHQPPAALTTGKGSRHSSVADAHERFIETESFIEAPRESDGDLLYSDVTPQYDVNLQVSRNGGNPQYSRDVTPEASGSNYWEFAVSGGDAMECVMGGDPNGAERTGTGGVGGMDTPRPSGRLRATFAGQDNGFDEDCDPIQVGSLPIHVLRLPCSFNFTLLLVGVVMVMGLSTT